MLQRDNALETVRNELTITQAELQKLSEQEAMKKLESLHKQLKTQTARAKTFWTQKYKQLLLHEIVLEERDEDLAAKSAEILNLQEELTNLIRQQ